MDRLADHEAFLRAIFAAPADDTPRLVYADFLDEAGDPDRAEFVRAQCELDRLAAGDDADRRAALEGRAAVLLERLGAEPGREHRRGFGVKSELVVAPTQLADPDAFRALVVARHPEWFGETVLRVEPDRALFPEEVPTLFALPVTQQVTEWNLGGQVEEIPAGPLTADGGTFGLIDLRDRPVVNTAGVEVLAQCRGARRVRTLVLTHNRLDNDAARALAHSPYLINLTRLDLYDGNRFRGRVWQELIARFGEAVVG